MNVLLRGGAGDGKTVPASGETAVWGACLYERTSDLVRVDREELRVYRHRPDRCERYGRGSEDRCE